MKAEEGVTVDEDNRRQGHTNYDWINGMRVGMIAGAIVGILIGVALGSFPFIWFIAGTATGGFIGAKSASRW